MPLTTTPTECSGGVFESVNGSREKKKKAVGGWQAGGGKSARAVPLARNQCDLRHDNGDRLRSLFSRDAIYNDITVDCRNYYF